MHRYSAKVRSIFSVLASIFLLILLVLLAACSDISGKDSTSGSVSFSFDSNFLQNVTARASEYTGGGINKSEDGAEETKEYTVQFEVNILGDYTDSKTVEWKTQNYPNVHPAHQDIYNQETESEKIEYPEQKVTFENIAVGKTVYAQVNVYVIYSDYSGETQKELIMNGKSVTKTITEGENTLPVSVSSIYKMFPVSIQVTFEKENEIPSNPSEFSCISVYAFKKDSDIVAKICKLCANEDDEAALEALQNSYDADGIAGMGFWYKQELSDDSENKAEYKDGVFTLTGKMNLLRDEELVFVALINYEGGTNGITYLGHVDANASNLEAVKSKAIVPNADGTNVELELFRMDTVKSLYALYNKTSEPSSPSGYSYNFNFTHESAISIEPSSTEGIETGVGSFAFDADGNYYVLVYNLTNYTYSIKSSNYSEAISIPSAISQIDGITIDRKQNVLYAWHGMGQTYDVYKFPKLISEGSTEYENVPGGDFRDEYFDHSKTLLAVHKGKVYGWVNGGSVGLSAGKLYRVDPADASPVAEMIGFDYEALGLSGDGTINDMFYQDGALYLLESERDFNKYNDKFKMLSRGSLIRYDVKTKKFDKCGFTDDSKATKFKFGTEAAANEKFQVFATNEYYLVFTGQPYSDNTLYQEFASKFNNSSSVGNIFTAHVPASSSLSSAFLGGQKFIAIKPKKLVIADSGISFYTDADGVWKYKNLNRIVTVDLNSFIIDSVQEVSSMAFDTKKTNNIIFLSSGYSAKMSLDPEKTFCNSQDRASYYEIGSGDTVFAGIICGDE